MFCEIVPIFHKQTLGIGIDQPQITKGHTTGPLLSVKTKDYHHEKDLTRSTESHLLFLPID